MVDGDASFKLDGHSMQSIHPAISVRPWSALPSLAYDAMPRVMPDPSDNKNSTRSVPTTACCVLLTRIGIPSSYKDTILVCQRIFILIRTALSTVQRTSE